MYLVGLVALVTIKGAGASNKHISRETCLITSSHSHVSIYGNADYHTIGVASEYMLNSGVASEHITKHEYMLITCAYMFGACSSLGMPIVALIGNASIVK